MLFTNHSPEILESDRVVIGLLADLIVDLEQLQLIAVRVHVVCIVDALHVDLVVENWNIDALDRDDVTCGGGNNKVRNLFVYPSCV